MRHLELARLAERLVMVPKRAAERRAGVGGARRHPDPAEVGIAQDARIGDAIEGHAAGQHQIARGIGGGEMASDVQHHILGHRL